MLKKITILLLLLGLTVFYACKDSVVSSLLPNKPPTTKLFLNPDSTISQQASRIHLYWSGDDPDGVIIGFYFSWDGTHWAFTTKNDSLFSLQIGVVDTTFQFKVSAVDNSGNGIYNSDVYQNGIHYGPEPFTDLNGNGKWDQGEPFVDIGAIDPNPASVKLPIKNTAPTIAWNDLSTHPDTSFTVMSFGWNASDIDGDETIQTIRIALNDTTKYVSLTGTIDLITIRTKDFTSANPMMDILVNGDQNNPARNPVTGDLITLPGILFNANNVFYVQAVDISGATSPWLSSATQKNSNAGWYVKKPKGKYLLVQNYLTLANDNPPPFYASMMDSIGLSSKYDTHDLAKQKFPYLNITFFETMKLFDCVIWYSDNAPALDLANSAVPKYLAIAGKKMFFSLQFPQSPDLTQVQGFLPIITDSTGYNASLVPNRTLSDTSHSGFPNLVTTASLARARTFYLSTTGVTPVYYLSDNSKYPRNLLNGYIGFETTSKNLFFLSMPLHRLNGIPGSVKTLLNKVLFTDFGLTK
jgi:hypothetical protein